MKIEYDVFDACSLEEFADKHGLTMLVNERPALPSDQRMRFYAKFDGSEVKDGAVLVGAFGDGSTPEAAISAYAEALRGRVLVLDAFGSERREIQCPNEWAVGGAAGGVARGGMNERREASGGL